MITVKKGNRTQVLRNEVQVAAFKANGWKVVETAGAKQENKKAPKGSENMKPPEVVPEQEPEQEQQG